MGEKMDSIKVQVNFTINTEFGEFTDALYFTLEEWSFITENKLNELKNERVNNWLNTIKNPVEEIQVIQETEGE
jgi:hypothetical protein